MDDCKMQYVNPAEVISPKDLISNVKIVFDGGRESFSIATLTWDGTPDCHAIRWNVSNREWDDERKLNGEIPCIGLPQSRGYATWFLLPDVYNDYIEDIIKKELQRISKETNH